MKTEGICGDCARVRPLGDDGRLVEHDRVILMTGFVGNLPNPGQGLSLIKITCRCSGSGTEPQTVDVEQAWRYIRDNYGG